VTLPVAQENDAPMAHTELSTGDVVLVMMPLLRPTSPPVKATSLGFAGHVAERLRVAMVEPGDFEPQTPPRKWSRDRDARRRRRTL